MEKCSSYFKNYWSDTLGYCMGTKGREACSCQGDESKCDFYPKERIKKMTTLDMMIEAKANGKTYHASDMLYNTELGFHNKFGKLCYVDNFCYINDLFDIDYWQLVDAICMTKSEAEEKYGIMIVGD